MVIGHQDSGAKNFLLIFTNVIFISCKTLFIYKDHTKTGGLGMAEMWLAPPPTFPYLKQMDLVSTGRSHHKSLLVLC